MPRDPGILKESLHSHGGLVIEASGADAHPVNELFRLLLEVLDGVGLSCAHFRAIIVSLTRQPISIAASIKLDLLLDPDLKRALRLLLFRVDRPLGRGHRMLRVRLHGFVLTRYALIGVN